MDKNRWRSVRLAAAKENERNTAVSLTLRFDSEKAPLLSFTTTLLRMGS